jgi:hypothetical protein
VPDLRGALLALLALAFAALCVTLPAAGHAGPLRSRAFTPRAVTGESRYDVQRTSGALVAKGGGLVSLFGEKGLSVATARGSVTFAVAGAAPGAPVADGGRVVYRRDGLTTWYANGPLGLEQGFTLSKPQAVSLRLAGSLAPRQRGQSILFGSALSYSGLRAFDAAGRPLPARLELRGRTLTLRVDDRGARYPITIDPQIEQQLASGGPLLPNDADPSGGSSFGQSVAISSDGNTALIGAPDDNANLGAAWVFVRSNGVWTQQGPKLLPDPNTLVGGSNGTTFGTSVALSGDGNTALIGGSFENSLHGAVWSTTRSNGVWSTPTKIPFPTDENGTAQFGSSVALSSDGTLAVIGGKGDGGSNVSSPTPNAGAAWVYGFSSGAWSQQAKLLPSSETGAGSFGASVAITTPCATCTSVVLVGAPADNSNVGAVWVYANTDGWITQTSLHPSDAIVASSFGTSVAISADGTVALVGGPTDDPNDGLAPFTIGSAWVFTAASLNSWSQTAHLLPTDATNFARFGSAVSLSGDGKTALVGGEGDTSSTGAAWVFTNGATWTQICKEYASENIAREFGHSVALSSDAGTELMGGPFSASTNGAAWAFVPGPCVSNPRSTVLSDVSARIQGTVDPNGHAVASYRVDYGTTTAYGASTTSHSLGAADAPASVDETLTGLQPSTLYHYRVAATSAEGTAGPDRTFVTGPQVAGTPGTPTPPTTLASGSGCPVATVTIDWGDGTTPDSTSPSCHLVGDSSVWTVSGTHSYAAVGHYVITVTFSTGPVYGAGALITSAPSISGTTSSGVTTSSSNVAATINPNGADTTYVVNYGPTTSYGSQTSSAAIGSSFSGQAAGQTLTGLNSSTTYHFQFVATNARGTTSGPDATFTTAAPPSSGGASAPATPPTILGEAAPSVAADSASVSGTVNPNGSATNVLVQYGTTASYGLQTPAAPAGAGTAPQVVNQTLSGLSPSTVYHYRFVATNDGGTTLGPDVTFTTAVPGGASAQPPPPPVQGISANVFPFQGTVLVNGQPLVVGQQIPFGATIDATHGTVVIQSVVNGVLQSIQVAGGVFQLLQLPDGTTQFVMTGGNFNVCNTKTKTKGVRVTHSTAAAPKFVRMLWGNGKGNFQTKGRYASATVRGTVYGVFDRCDGTLVEVREGTVTVTDLVHHKIIIVGAGKSVLVNKP